LIYAGKVAYKMKGTCPAHVEIKDGTKEIADGAFYGCTGLTSIEIPDSVTRIGRSAFSNCTGLTSVNIPTSVTSIGTRAFAQCTGLTSVEIPDSVTSIGSMAFGYYLIPDTKLIPGFTIYGYEGSEAERYANNNGITFEKLGLLSGTTGDCTWTLSDDGVLTISGNGATGDYSYTYSSQGTYITTAPWGANINSVVIEDGVTSIGDYAFTGCTGLMSIEIPDSVTSINFCAFSGCTGFTSIDIPNSVTCIANNAFSSCTGLMSVNIPDSVTSIGGSAFAGCTGLNSIEIPDSVTSIGDSAFAGCTGLTSIDIPDSVTRIGSSAFSGTAWYDNQPDGLVYSGKFAYKMKGTCPAHVEIKDGTKGIADGAFSGCTGLTSIDIPDSVTSIGWRAFEDCIGLTSIDIPDSVTSIGGNAFSGCRGLASIKVSNSVTSIEYKVFNNCKKLTSIDIPDSVASLGEGAFSGCAGLTSINIPDSVISIGNVAFYGCKGLTSIDIPDSVTSIGWSAFSGCTGLTSIDIPDSVTSIGSSALFGCTGLTSVFIPNSVTSIGRRAFGYYYDSGDKLLAGFTIYGYENTAAEAYANDNSITFIPVIGECDNCHGYLVESDYSEGYPATCTADGLMDGYICPSCHYVGKTVIPAIGHKPVVDKGYPATCIKDGLTDGTHCSVCNEVLVSQTVVPATGHKPVVDKGYPATCIKDGLTDGSHCSVCNEVLVAQQIIPKGAHRESIPVQENLVNATCTEYGSYDEVVYCTECGEELSRRNIKTTKPLGHKYETVPGKPATCSEEGLTEGKVCTRCGDVLIAQEPIPKLAHTESKAVREYTPATCIEIGRYDDVVYCSVCGEELSRVNISTTPMIDHTYRYVPVAPATYFHSGLTDGMRCTYCGDWLIEPDEIPMLVGKGVFCDVDGDEEVSPIDVTFIMRWLADMTVPFELDEMWADVDDDGELSILDVTLIQRWLADLKSIDHIGMVFE